MRARESGFFEGIFATLQRHALNNGVGGDEREVAELATRDEGAVVAQEARAVLPVGCQRVNVHGVQLFKNGKNGQALSWSEMLLKKLYRKMSTDI